MVPRLAARAALLFVLACGDNVPGDQTPDAPVAPPDMDMGMEDAPPGGDCTPKPAPTAGSLADPLALELPATCVPGGIAAIAGRWFVSVPDRIFSFEYPAFEGSCETGFERSGLEEQALAEGYQSVDSWNDGTRVWYRKYFGREQFEFVEAFAACVLPDGTIAVNQTFFDTDRGARSQALTGTKVAQAGAEGNGISLTGSVTTRPGETSPIIAYNLVVDENYAYVCGPEGLDIIEITNPAAPVHRAVVEGDFNDCKLVAGNGRRVVFLSPLFSSATAVVDVTDPLNPDRLPDLQEFSHSIFVETSGGATRLYMANTESNSMSVYDVTNPIAPSRLGAVRIAGGQGGQPAGVHDLFVDGDTVYANNGTDGLVALDISTSLTNPVTLGRAQPTGYSHASWRVEINGHPYILHGDEGMQFDGRVGSHLRVLEGDPTSPNFLDDVGAYATRTQLGIHNIIAVGNKAYIAYYHDGVRVVSLADPTNPVEVAHYNTWDWAQGYGGTFEGAVGLRVANGHIYVADFNRGLLILTED